MTRADGGFSLLEMLLVLAILALAATLVVPRLGAGVPGARTALAARVVANTVTELRSAAIRDNRAQMLVIGSGGASLALPEGTTATLEPAPLRRPHDPGRGRLADGPRASFRGAAMTRGEDGFTLAEALVSLLILSLALTALLAAFSTTFRHAQGGARHLSAVETARSLLAGAGIAKPLSEGLEEGVSAEGLPWRIEVARRKVPHILEATPKVSAFWVTVTVGPVRLTTLRLETP
jgi:prepilin-type N-terminal cleavage/methylation domain-containing protein